MRSVETPPTFFVQLHSKKKPPITWMLLLVPDLLLLTQIVIGIDLGLASAANGHFGTPPLR